MDTSLNLVQYLFQWGCNKIKFSYWFSDWCLMPRELYFSYIMSGTRYISLRWWRCPLCTIIPTRLDMIFIVLTHWNKSLRVYTLFLFFLDILSWFWNHVSLPLLLNVVWLAEKQQIPAEHRTRLEASNTEL